MNHLATFITLTLDRTSKEDFSGNIYILEIIIPKIIGFKLTLL